MDIQFIQGITSLAALILGVAYVIGGLIVNLHLAQFGITEYQVLRVKYLVVGLIYLVAIAVMIIIGTVVLLIAVVVDPSKAIFQGNYIPLTAIISLIVVGVMSIISVRRKRIHTGAGLLNELAQVNFIGLGTVSLIYPIGIVFREALGINNGVLEIVYVATAILVGLLAFVAQIFYYSRFVYGNSSALDLIGMGVPVAIQVAGTEADITLLSHMGIPVTKPDLTDKISLVDETDTQYIVSVESDAHDQIYKIGKELVKAIIYLKEQPITSKKGNKSGGK